MNLKCLFGYHKWKEGVCERCAKRNAYFFMPIYDETKKSMNCELDLLREYRGDTPDDDIKIISELENHIGLKIDPYCTTAHKVVTSSGVWIATVHRIALDEDSLEKLLQDRFGKNAITINSIRGYYSIIVERASNKQI